MDPFLEAALEEACKGMSEGGIPIGSVLVIDGEIVGRDTALFLKALNS
jgi:cytosine deaminase